MSSNRSVARPGRWQRWRALVLVGIALLVWGLRWLWPLQGWPGWIVALLFAWAGFELIRLCWFPHRWR